MEFKKWQKYYIALWVVFAVYMIPLKEHIEAAIPILNIVALLALLFQVWFMSLFKKKKYYLIVMFSLQFFLGILENVSDQLPMQVQSIVEGMDMGEVVGYIAGIM